MAAKPLVIPRRPGAEASADQAPQSLERTIKNWTKSPDLPYIASERKDFENMAVTAVALKRKVYDSPEEMALVHRAKHGDQDAFTALYNHHFNRLRIVINRMIRNDSEAEWLANVALTKTWEHLKEFDEKSKFSTWVTRTAINEGLMYLRHQKTQRQTQTCSLDSN